LRKKNSSTNDRLGDSCQTNIELAPAMPPTQHLYDSYTPFQLTLRYRVQQTNDNPSYNNCANALLCLTTLTHASVGREKKQKFRWFRRSLRGGGDSQCCEQLAGGLSSPDFPANETWGIFDLMVILRLEAAS